MYKIKGIEVLLKHQHILRCIHACACVQEAKGNGSVTNSFGVVVVLVVIVVVLLLQCGVGRVAQIRFNNTQIRVSASSTSHIPTRVCMCTCISTQNMKNTVEK